MNHCNESRHQKRGPLIGKYLNDFSAVIKIELDDENTDRIFLHSKDNDEELAQEFIVKHDLNRMLKKHIYEKIKMSRQTVVDHEESHEGANESINYDEETEFVTPIQKRQIQNQEKSIDKYQQKNQQKIIKNDDKQLTSHKNFLRYDANNDFQFQNLKSSQEIKRQTSFQKISAGTEFKEIVYHVNSEFKLHTNHQSESYRQIKNKTLYDITGLKLRTTHSTSNNHPSQKQNKFQKQNSHNPRSFSSKEICQMHIKQQNNENKKINQQMLNHQNNNKQEKQSNKEQKAISNFIETFQKSFRHNDPCLKNYRNYEGRQLGRKNSLNKELFNKRIESFEEQTKFSSINKETDEYEFTQDNYISFNIPYFQNSDSLPQQQSSTLVNQLRLGVKQSNQNSVYNPQKTDSKQLKLRQLHQSSSLSKKSLEGHVLFQQIQNENKIEDQDLCDESEKFINLIIKEQQNLFKKQQNNFKRQQNVQINNLENCFNCQYDQQSWRPSKVKFYGKQEMKTLRQSTMSKSLLKTDLSRINKAVTSRLYNEEEIKKKYLNQLKAKAKNIKDQQNQEEQQLTHKPQINQLSKILALNRRKENQTLSDYLIEQGHILQQKRQDQINLLAKKQLQQCSFKPLISENSKKIIQIQRSQSKSKITSYHGKISRCSSFKNVQSKKQLFHPQINKLSEEIAKQKGNFIQRQKTFEEEKNKKFLIKQQQQRETQKIDLKTGKKFFHPQLTPRSIKLAQHYNQQNRQNSQQSVHSYLYGLSKTSHRQEKLNPKPFINSISQKLINQLHQKRINWLFLELDSDEDGVISNHKISIENIPTQMLQIIAPVLYEMEELETKLTLEDFRCAVKNLNKGLNPWQKSVLYGYRASVRA